MGVGMFLKVGWLKVSSMSRRRDEPRGRRRRGGCGMGRWFYPPQQGNILKKSMCKLVHCGAQIIDEIYRTDKNYIDYNVGAFELDDSS